MSHTRWDDLRPIPGHIETQMAYVDGYLLALEDVAQDLKEILETHPVPTEARELATLLRRRMHQSRSNSHRTMRALSRAHSQKETHG